MWPQAVHKWWFVQVADIGCGNGWRPSCLFMQDIFMNLGGGGGCEKANGRLKIDDKQIDNEL